MLKWFDTAAAVAQADRAVEEIERLVPHDDVAAARGKQFVKLDQTISNHRLQCASAKYNFYQKAKFANRVKWRLHDAGYQDEFVDSLVRLLII
jgi:hypothetical protein